jgi:hypothetical protein
MVILSEIINTSTLINQPILLDYPIRANIKIDPNLDRTSQSTIFKYIIDNFHIEQDTYKSFKFVEIPTMISKVCRVPRIIQNIVLDIIYMATNISFGIAYNTNPDLKMALYTSYFYSTETRRVLYVPVKNPNFTIVKISSN